MSKACAKCGEFSGDSARFCPRCGSREWGRASHITISPASSNGVSPLVLKIGGGLLALLLLFGFLRYWENAKAEAEIHRQEALARLELERKRQEMELEFERRKREEAEAREREQARQAEQEAAANAAAVQQEQGIKSAIEAIEVGQRRSYMGDMKDTYVLQLRNIRDFTVSFNLKCCTVQESCKTLHVSIAPYTVQEIGFLEGWPGNFVKGEYCRAYYEDESLWKVTI